MTTDVLGLPSCLVRSMLAALIPLFSALGGHPLLSARALAPVHSSLFVSWHFSPSPEFKKKVFSSLKCSVPVLASPATSISSQNTSMESPPHSRPTGTVPGVAGRYLAPGGTGRAFCGHPSSWGSPSGWGSWQVWACPMAGLAGESVCLRDGASPLLTLPSTVNEVPLTSQRGIWERGKGMSRWF